MAKQCTIPNTIEDAVKQLNGLGRLLTATEWERAAIVATFVEPRAGQGSTSRNSAKGRLSANAFAALGIAGLRSDHTVLRYVQAWEASGLPRPRPGAVVDLPRKAWADHYDTTTTGGRPRATVDEIVKRATEDESYARTLTARLAKAQPAIVASAGETLARTEQVARASAERERGEAAVERVERNTARALDIDRVAMHLRAAAREIGAAIATRDVDGITNKGQVTEALRALHRMTTLFESGRETFTDNDRTFLETLGVTL